MIIIHGLVLSAALAWWIICTLGNFWFARQMWRTRRRGTISKAGDRFYDSCTVGAIFMFTMAGIMSACLVFQTWKLVMQL